MKTHGRPPAIVSALLALILCAGALAPAALAEDNKSLILEPVETFGPTLQPLPIQPNPELPEQGRERTYGDIDGDGTPDGFDAARLLQQMVGIRTSYVTLTLGDANGDENTDMRDAAYILGHPKGPWITYYEQVYVVYKPAIYLYPETQTDVTVTLGDPDALTCAYPAYNGGWRVTAAPDGTLTGTTGREYYCLYYEADTAVPGTDTEDGFVIPRTEITDFLEQKLAILGLSEREAEEMIIYWLPRMQQSEYVFIRFAPQEVIDEAMPLSIDPAPDTVIRVWMQWKGLDAPEDAPAQELTPVSREGFTAVEWGGMEID